MKKILFLIIILMIGLTSVSAQTAQSTFSQAELDRFEELQDQLKHIEAKVYEGTGNPTELEQQVRSINEEMERVYLPLIMQSAPAGQQLQEIGDRMKKWWPGARAGWLPDEIFPNRGTPRLTKPDGVRISWSGRVDRGTFRLYLVGADERLYEQIKSQIEIQTRIPMVEGEPVDQVLRRCSLDIPDILSPDDPSTGVTMYLSLSPDRIIYRVSAWYGDYGNLER